MNEVTEWTLIGLLSVAIILGGVAIFMAFGSWLAPRYRNLHRVDGFRAQYAEVVALSATGFEGKIEDTTAVHPDGVEVVTPSRFGFLQNFADAYDVPLVAFCDLEEVARQHGDVVPKSLRPPRRRKAPRPIEATPGAIAPGQANTAPVTIAYGLGLYLLLVAGAIGLMEWLG